MFLSVLLSRWYFVVQKHNFMAKNIKKKLRGLNEISMSESNCMKFHKYQRCLLLQFEHEAHESMNLNRNFCNLFIFNNSFEVFL